MSDLTDNLFYPSAERKWLWPCDPLTEDDDFGKKNHLFRWSSFWSWRVCKQAKLSHLGHRNPARIYWKAAAPKTSYCLVRILVQRHNWAIFLRKWARRGCYSQWRSLSGHVVLFLKHFPKRKKGIWRTLYERVLMLKFFRFDFTVSIIHPKKYYNIKKIILEKYLSI